MPIIGVIHLMIFGRLLKRQGGELIDRKGKNAKAYKRRRLMIEGAPMYSIRYRKPERLVRLTWLAGVPE